MTIQFKLTAVTVFVLLAPFAAGLFTGVTDVMFGGSNQGVGRRPLQKFYDLLDLWKDQEEQPGDAPSVGMKWACVFMAASGALLAMGEGMGLCAITFGAGIFLMQGSWGKGRWESRLLLGIPVLFSVAGGMILLMGTDETGAVMESHQSLMGYLPGIWIGILVIMVMVFAGLREEKAAGTAGAAWGYRMVALWYALCTWAGLLYVFMSSALSENSWTVGIVCILLCVAAELISRILSHISFRKHPHMGRNGALVLLATLGFNLLVISFRMR